MTETLILQFDGGSRGNPGPAGIGVVISSKDGVPLVTLGRYIGRATNNVAEYRALIAAMQEALKLGATKIVIRGDSELIIRQMLGQYRVKHPDLKPLYEEAQELLKRFADAQIEHNRRHHNAMADELANLAMDRKCEVTELAAGSSASGSTVEEEETPESPKPGEKVACGRCGCVVEVVKPSSLRPHQLKPFGCQCGGKMEGLPPKS